MNHTTKLDCVLLVDDHVAMNYLNALVLEENNFAARVVEATSAKKALQYLDQADKEAHPVPNIIFIDLNMPGMNGWELHESVKDRPELQRTLFAILTASNAPEGSERAQQTQGIDGFFEKPLTDESLAKMKQIYLERFGVTS